MAAMDGERCQSRTERSLSWRDYRADHSQVQSFRPCPRGHCYHGVKGEWRYLSRAVEAQGQAVDVLLTQHRDEDAAEWFLTKTIRRHGVSEKFMLDGSTAVDDSPYGRSRSPGLSPTWFLAMLCCNREADRRPL
jgi:hypothetical protein